jgi:hypothetical protein
MAKTYRLLGFILLVFLCAPCHLAHAAAAEGLAVGASLPEFQIMGPIAKADQEYLGLKDTAPFTLAQVSGKLVIMDFVSVL